MEVTEYDKYVMAECKRQWHENQEEFYGPWEDQSVKTQAEYYYEMYELLKEEF